MTTVHTATLNRNGIFVPVNVECVIEPGIGIHLVGLADAQVKEALLRVVTCLQSCGYSLPGKKIIINLTPADVRKEGGGYDLPIALAILLESGQVQFNPEDFIFYGECALDGSLRRTGYEDELVFQKPLDLARDFVFAEEDYEEDYDFQFMTLPALINYAQNYFAK